jgi:iron complex outermembrane recepter protein
VTHHHASPPLCDLHPTSIVRQLSRYGLQGIGAVMVFASFAASNAGATRAADIAATDTLNTIVITARKRDEPLAEVPASVTVFPSGSLAAFDIQSFNDYATKTPNLSFNYGSGTTGISAARSVAIRGVAGQNLFGTAGATGFYIDDTPVPGSVDPRVVDLDDIEVLKGPQGTLYGESSLAGNVRLVTKKPNLAADGFGYMAQAGVTSGGGSADGGGNFIGNVVLVPGELALRAVLFINHDAGYLTRSYPNPSDPAASAGVTSPFASVARSSVNDQGADTTGGGSVSVLWQAADNLDAEVRVMFQDTSYKGFPAAFAPLPAFQPSYTLDRAFDVQPRASDNWALPSINLKYSGRGWALNSATSYFDRHSSDIEDSTYGTQQIFASYYKVDGLPAQPYLWDQEHRLNQLSEELRLSFDPRHDLSGTVGTFYSRTRTRLSIPPTYATGLTTATVGNTVIGPWPNDLIWTDYNPQTQDDISLFGELYWKFRSRFTATVGARQYWLKQTSDFTADGFNNGGPTLSDPQKSSQSGFNPKLGLSYQASEAAMVYASASKGFRAGGAQPFLPFCALPTLPVSDITQLKSDTLWSYELGTKVEVPRTGLLISAAAFHIDWKNFQQQVALPCGAYFSINGDTARINGAEFEVTGHLSPAFELRLSLGYEKTDITEPGALAIVGVLPGSRVLGTPAWNASVGGVYTRPLTATLAASIEADVSYTGNSTSLLNGGGGALAVRPSYCLADLRFGVQRGRSEVSVNIHNLTNARPNLGDIGYVGYAQYTSTGSIIPQVATLQPLTVLLRYRYAY